MPEPTPHKGQMYKKGEKRRNWLLRHFTLFNGALCYYTNAETKNPKGFILTKEITECRHKTSEKVGSKSGKGEFCFEVVTKGRTYYFAPETAEGRDEWMAAIQSWIGYSEDISTKELPEPGASQRNGATATTKEAETTETTEEKTETETKEADAEEAKADAPTEEPAKDEPAKDEPAAETEGDAEATPTTDAETATETDVSEAAAPAADATATETTTEEPKADEPAAEQTETEPTSSTEPAPEAEDEQEILKYRSEYDYDAQEDNELSFKEGDVVTVLDTFKGAGWWKAADSSGKVGLIPGNFFVKVE